MANNGNSSYKGDMSNENNNSNNGFVPREMTGTMFYDAPGVPTLKGAIQKGQSIEVTGEPAVDKNQKQYSGKMQGAPPVFI